ncbi:MAG: tetratricopeptide repeat protein [Rhodomicrobium sp.]
MHEIFISYSSKHRELTRELAAAIEAQYGAGSVWWDHELESRASYQEQIRAALDAARVAVVLWTEGAAISNWVYAEAIRAFEQNKLVNVRAPDMSFAAIPEPFNIHHMDEADDRDGILATIGKIWNGVPIPTRAPLDELYFRHHGRRLIEPKQDKLSPDPRRILPSELLQARYAVTPYIDATGAKADCVAWSLSGERAAGRLIHAPGGFGKTRLMIEVAAELRARGWTAGFFDRAHRQDADILKQRWQALEQRVRHGEDSGLLLVVDYAEGRQAEVAELGMLLANAPGDRPLRLVLLARSGADWWERLRDEHPELQRLFRRGAGAGDAEALQPIASPKQRRALFETSTRQFWPILRAQGVAKPSQPPANERLRLIWNGKGFERPLAIQMEALLWLCAASPAEASVAAQLNAVLGLERKHWEKLCGALDGDARRDMERGAAQVTLVGGTPSRAASERLLMEDDFYKGRRTARVDVAAPLGHLARVYLRGAGLAAIEPDLLGEHHAAMTADDETIEGCLRWIAAQPEDEREKRRRDLITTLQRASLPVHGDAAAAKAAARLDWLIRNRMAELAEDIVAVMADTPGQLVPRIERALEDLDFDALRALDAALPKMHLKLLELALAVSTRHVASAKAALSNAETGEQDAEANDSMRNLAASAMHWFGTRLGAVGRFEEALAAASEAVDIRRHLVDGHPEVFLPDLATSLNNLGLRLLDLGRREEALAASSEAADIYKRLAEARPDAFLPELARALHNLGNSLSALGRPEEALRATREAVDIRRRLAKARPDAFLSDLETSLNNLGNRLSTLGCLEEGLAAASEAADLCRRLAETRPDAFLPDLANCLNNLGIRLANLGRQEEALIATSEATDIFRPLAEARPDAFQPDLALSLQNLGAMLSALGRREKALAATSEAADIRRRLAEARPDAFLPDLATSLNNLGHCLFDLGRLEESLIATSEAADIFRRLAEARPDSFLPGLAMSLINLGDGLSALGRRQEALAASVEAVAIQGSLAESRPDAFGPHLAQYLGIKGDILSAMDRHADAAAVLTEALTIVAPFAEKLPQAFAPLARNLGRAYIDACEAGATPRDDALLERAGTALMRALPDEERAEAEALLAAAKEEAAKAEKAEEEALALLPPHLAEQLRAGAAAKKQTAPAEG